MLLYEFHLYQNYHLAQVCRLQLPKNNYLFNRSIMMNFFNYQIWFDFTTGRSEGVKLNSFDSEKHES